MWAWSWARGAPQIWGFPFYISATAEASDFKFGFQLGFLQHYYNICSTFPFVAAVCTHKLVNSCGTRCTVNDTLFHAGPTKYLTGAASLRWHFEDRRVLDMLLYDATDAVVYQVNVEAVDSGDVNCDVILSRNQTMMRALCARALSCWKIKNSPGNKRMVHSSMSSHAG